MTNDKDKSIEQIEADLKNKFGKKHGFTVPDGYFEDLNKAIHQGIEQNAHSRKTKIIRIAFTAAAAACASLLITLMVNTGSKTDRTISGLSEPLLDEFYFDGGELEDLAIEEGSEIFTMSVDLDEEELIDYLEYHNVPIEFLLEDI